MSQNCVLPPSVFSPGAAASAADFSFVLEYTLEGFIEQNLLNKKGSPPPCAYGKEGKSRITTACSDPQTTGIKV